MGKNKKQIHTKKEEEQGKRVLAILGVVGVILALIMFIGYSFLF